MTVTLSSPFVRRAFLACRSMTETTDLRTVDRLHAVQVPGFYFFFEPEAVEKWTTHIATVLEDLYAWPRLREGASMLELTRNRAGAQWGNATDVLRLVALGIAAELLEAVEPPAQWDHLPGQVPTIRRRFDQV